MTRHGLKYEWSTAAHAPRGTLALVRDALVPMFIWPQVPVIKVVRDRLTALERIACEAALDLAPVRPEDLVELTDVPPDVIERILARLVTAGALERAADADHMPTNSTPQVLAEQEIARYEPSRLSFLLLPATDDVLALPPGGDGKPDPPNWNRARPLRHWPVPPGLAGSSRYALLAPRIADRRIVGLPDDVVGAGEPVTGDGDGDGEWSDDQIPDTCPLYRCRGRVQAIDGECIVFLEVYADPKEPSHPLSGRLDGAKGLAEQWRRLSTGVAEAVQRWPGEVTAVPDGPCTWTIRLSAVAAQAAAEDVAREGLVLTREVGLLIRGDVYTMANVIRFVPDDDAARVVFAVEHATQAIIQEPDLAKLKTDALRRATDQARTTYALTGELTGEEVTAQAVETRLWQLRQYQHLYALRRERDFAYA